MGLALSLGGFLAGVGLGALVVAPRLRREPPREGSRLDAELERLRHDIATARRVQEAFYPRELPSVEGLRLLVRHATARELGGDFHDIRLLDDDSLGLFVADVSGKGVPAALLTGMLRGLFEEAVRLEQSPAGLLARMNHRMYPYTPEFMFATAFCARIDLHQHLLTWSSAGHEPGVLAREGRGRLLLGSGPPLGTLPEYRYENGREPLEVGSRLVVLTDGLTNWRSPEPDRTLRIVEECDGTPEELWDRLLAFASRGADGKLDDDAVLAVVDRL